MCVTIQNATFVSMMLLVAIIDWKQYVIPNTIVLIGASFGLSMDCFFARPEIIAHFASSLSALCFMLVLRQVGSWLFRRPALGMGDVKLGAMVGYFFGFWSFLIALWLSAVLGCIYETLPANLKTPAALCLHTVHATQPFTLRRIRECDQRMNHPTERVLPFGSFLAVSSIIVLLFQPTITQGIEEWSTYLR